MRNLVSRWRQPGHIFPKSRQFFQLSKKDKIGIFLRHASYAPGTQVYRPMAYSEPCQIATTERLVQMVNGYNYFRR